MLTVRSRDGKLIFARMSRAEINGGIPAWRVEQMVDGTDTLIYVPTGLCLGIIGRMMEVGFAGCDLQSHQRWQPVHAAMVGGEPVVALRLLDSGGCLTALPKPWRRVMVADCGPVRTRNQEVAFWWGPPRSLNAI
jgi:hypothetical protein